MKFNRRTENLIASLRGLPPDNSYAILRSACPLDSAIEVVLEKYKIGQESPEEMIMSQWDLVIGKQFAKACRPVKITMNKELIVAVSNPMVRQELMFNRRQIIRNIRALNGCGHIKDIILRSG